MLQVPKIGIAGAAVLLQPSLQHFPQETKLAVVELQADPPRDRGSEPLQIDAGCQVGIVLRRRGSLLC